MRLSGALQKKKNSELSYREIVKNSSNDETIAAKQVMWGSQPVRKGVLGRACVPWHEGEVTSKIAPCWSPRQGG